MREFELKSVVADESLAVRRLLDAGGALRFTGRIADRRYDTLDGALRARDEVLRLRVESDGSHEHASVDFKGAAAFPGGYKLRDELILGIDNHEVAHALLLRLGYVVTREIDREVAVYELRGATVRFERYPRMDVLVEVEGAPRAIEAAIEALAIPREDFSGERLVDFARRFEARTGERAAICDRELTGDYRYRLDDA